MSGVLRETSRKNGYDFLVAKLRRHAPYLLVILILPLLILAKAIFYGEAIGPFDQIAALAPFSKGNPTTAWDILQADGVIQFYVWRDLVFESWRSGHVPFWNPYELCGTPLLANSQSGGLYPPHIVASFLPVPTHTAISLLAWFHFAVAGAGVYALARTFGANRVGALVGAAIFQTSTFMIGWTALASVISTVCWIPWVLANLQWAWRGKRATLGIGISLGLMILAGHLQFVAYGFMVVGLMLVWLIATDRPNLKANGAKVGLALAAGVLLAMPQLLPALSFGKFSHRQNSPSTDGYQAYVAGAIPGFALAGVAAGPVLGDPSSLVESGSPFSSYWPAYVKRGDNAAETAVGISLIGLALLFFARSRFNFRKHGVLAVAGGMALLLGLGTPLNMALYYLVPGWSATGSPGRIYFLVVMCVAVLASVVASRPPERDAAAPTYKPLIPLVGVVLLTLASLSFLSSFSTASWLPGLSPEVMAALIAKGSANGKVQVMLLLLVALVSVGAWIFDRQRGTWWLVAGIAASVLLIPTVRTSPFEDLHTKAPTAPGERVAVVTGGWDLLQRGKSILPPNLAALSRVREVGGYDSLIHRDTVTMLKEMNKHEPAPAANGNIMHVKKTATEEALAAMGARQKLSQDADGKPLWTKIDGPGRISVDKGTFEVVEDKPGLIKIKVSEACHLTVRERAIGGWTATDGGRALQLKDSPWLEVDVSEPDVVGFKYTAPGYSLGLLLAFIGLALLGLCAYLSNRSK